ncbi:MAG: hypothetical protein P1Q69_10535 [Candidatus Thorarchaeota archaeon]|nr:hypothetical protein [Candidatus Thorarchaeota archaeon]
MPEIVRAVRIQDIYEIRPDLIHPIYDAINATKERLAYYGYDILCSIIDGYYRSRIVYQKPGGKTIYEQYFNETTLYEDHEHEKYIRLEFRVQWTHEKYSPNTQEVTTILKEELRNKLQNLYSAETIFGHYMEITPDMSHILVCLFFERL